MHDQTFNVGPTPRAAPVFRLNSHQFALSLAPAQPRTVATVQTARRVETAAQLGLLDWRPSRRRDGCVILRPLRLRAGGGTLLRARSEAAHRRWRAPRKLHGPDTAPAAATRIVRPRAKPAAALRAPAHSLVRCRRWAPRSPSRSSRPFASRARLHSLDCVHLALHTLPTPNTHAHHAIHASTSAASLAPRHLRASTTPCYSILAYTPSSRRPHRHGSLFPPPYLRAHSHLSSPKYPHPETRCSALGIAVIETYPATRNTVVRIIRAVRVDCLSNLNIPVRQKPPPTLHPPCWLAVASVAFDTRRT